MQSTDGTKLRSLASAVVTLGEGGNLDAALVMVEQLRAALLELKRGGEPEASRTRFDRILVDE